MFSYLIGVVGFIVYFVTFVTCMRTIKSSSYLKHLTLLAIIIYVMSVVLLHKINIGTQLSNFSCMYWFLVMCFYFLFFGLYKSISVRVVVDLLNAEHNSLDYSYVVNEYLSNESFNRRLAVLERQGMISKNDGCYSFSNKAKKYIVLYRLIQQMYKIKLSG